MPGIGLRTNLDPSCALTDGEFLGEPIQMKARFSALFAVIFGMTATATAHHLADGQPDTWQSPQSVWIAPEPLSGAPECLPSPRSTPPPERAGTGHCSCAKMAGPKPPRGKKPSTFRSGT